MSKGSLIILLAFLITFLPFTGFPTGVKTVFAIVFGLMTMALGFLVRQERIWLLSAIKGESKTDAHPESQKI